MALTVKDLNPHGYPTDTAIDEALNTLCERLNGVCEAYGKPFVVTSGLRDMAKQEELIKEGKSTAAKSKHLFGQAADIYDPDGELKKWVLANLPLMEQIGFWFEDFAYTKNWVHFQCVPYGSWKPGKSRLFIP